MSIIVLMRPDHEPEPPPVQQVPPPIQPPLTAQPQPQQDDLIHRLVPARNGAALTAYYCGVFSLVCFIGIPLAFVAIGAGVQGIRVHNQDPSRRGLYHAIAGIVLGCLSLVAHAVVIYLLRS